MRYKKKEFLKAFDDMFDDDIAVDVTTGSLNIGYEMTMELNINPIKKVSVESYEYCGDMSELESAIMDYLDELNEEDK